MFRRVPAAVALVLAAVLVAFGPVQAASPHVGTLPNQIGDISVPLSTEVTATYTPSAVATSGDAVEVTLDANSAGCTLDDGVVTFTVVGDTCLIDFNDPGNDSYAAAGQVQQDIVVTAMANTITVTTLPSDTEVGATYEPAATATSGDTVSITLAATSAGCTLVAGVVTFTVPGDVCDVQFADPGNDVYGPAGDVDQEIPVARDANEIIARTLPSTEAVGDEITPTATAISGDTVEITLDATSTGCDLESGVLTFTSAGGICLVDYADPGNVDFVAAPTLGQRVDVVAASTTTGLAMASSAGVLTLTATVSGSDQGGTVAFHINGSTPAPCHAVSVAANGRAVCTLAYGPYGLVKATATYSGDANYTSSTSSRAELDNRGQRTISPFSDGSTSLTKGLVNQVRYLAHAISTGVVAHVQLVGYCDNSLARSAARSQSLAWARAVALQLAHDLKGLHVKRVTVTVVGKGRANAIASNKSARGRSKNRRVVATFW